MPKNLAHVAGVDAFFDLDKQGITLAVDIEFDLGGLYELSGIRLWNAPFSDGNRGAKDIEVFTTATDGGEFVLIYRIELSKVTGPTRGERFEITPTRAHDVRFRITSNHLGPLGPELGLTDNRTGFAEVRFIGTRVKNAANTPPPPGDNKPGQ